MITPDVDFFGTSSSRLFPGLVTTVGELSTSSFGNSGETAALLPKY